MKLWMSQMKDEYDCGLMAGEWWLLIAVITAIKMVVIGDMALTFLLDGQYAVEMSLDGYTMVNWQNR